MLFKVDEGSRCAGRAAREMLMGFYLQNEVPGRFLGVAVERVQRHPGNPDRRGRARQKLRGKRCRGTGGSERLEVRASSRQPANFRLKFSSSFSLAADASHSANAPPRNCAILLPNTDIHFPAARRPSVPVAIVKKVTKFYTYQFHRTPCTRRDVPFDARPLFLGFFVVFCVSL